MITLPPSVKAGAGRDLGQRAALAAGRDRPGIGPAATPVPTSEPVAVTSPRRFFLQKASTFLTSGVS
jgi:hypothetical protein